MKLTPELIRAYLDYDKSTRVSVLTIKNKLAEDYRIPFSMTKAEFMKTLNKCGLPIKKTPKDHWILYHKLRK